MKRIFVGVGAIALSAMCTLSHAETPLPNHAALLLSMLESAAASPATSAGSPTAYTPGWGSVFAGLAGATRTQSRSAIDGSAVAGLGFGDANKTVGAEIAGSLISLNPADGGFAKDGNVNAKIGRNISGDLAVAVGGDNLLAWGNAKNTRKSYYVVGTKIFFLDGDSLTNQMPLVVSVGYGNGRFQSKPSKNTNVASKTIGLFANAGLQLIPRFGVVGDWTGQMLNAGVSFVPVETWPVTVSMTATDLTNRTGNHVPIVVAVGASFNFA